MKYENLVKKPVSIVSEFVVYIEATLYYFEYVSL
jgi:hypothetical protein